MRTRPPQKVNEIHWNSMTGQFAFSRNCKPAFCENLAGFLRKLNQSV